MNPWSARGGMSGLMIKCRMTVFKVNAGSRRFGDTDAVLACRIQWARDVLSSYAKAGFGVFFLGLLLIGLYCSVREYNLSFRGPFSLSDNLLVGSQAQVSSFKSRVNLHNFR
ncbi:uncharacterized protein BT62DRAFT_930858 [Guyanagaster necrorhizus]|uniref:Uncharacterized protein n=1 Tax=Guyanagaster necrorhizus TaxID=856835 RepID=A0A9P8ATV5_9AGAR|nr:uncharacterized protein BT62DRAFT_930858 [Guyanagaster necrorhizus MCA 3950]KAG7447814.1 hypothetical protein BT62DRAFT_930858 [Guyanagaster necrorhizus MCA 3950]